MEKFIEMLGYRYYDRVTNYSGVAESMCFDLYGCVQFALRPPVTKDGKMEDGRWFDVTRLVREGEPNSRCMELPDYSKLLALPVLETPAFNAPGSGPADKSTMRRG